MSSDRLSQAVSSLIEVLDLIDYATSRVRSERDRAALLIQSTEAAVLCGELATVLGELAAVRGQVTNIKTRLER